MVSLWLLCCLGMISLWFEYALSYGFFTVYRMVYCMVYRMVYRMVWSRKKVVDPGPPLDSLLLRIGWWPMELYTILSRINCSLLRLCKYCSEWELNSWPWAGGPCNGSLWIVYSAGGSPAQARVGGMYAVRKPSKYSQPLEAKIEIRVLKGHRLGDVRLPRSNGAEY